VALLERPTTRLGLAVRFWAQIGDGSLPQLPAAGSSSGSSILSVEANSRCALSTLAAAVSGVHGSRRHTRQLCLVNQERRQLSERRSAAFEGDSSPLKDL
jgi:hypothetical protein